MAEAAITRHKILFVDDDPYVLKALARNLRSYSDRFDLTFVNSGAQALACLCAEPFDILVTDMVMPGIDGAALLHKVTAQWPSIIRIVLSGHAEFEQSVRSVPFAHQRLAKPWSRDTLLATLERACSLRDLVDDEVVRGRLSRIGALPSSLQTYTQLCCELDKPNASFASIAALLESDMAMSAKVLQLANSVLVASSRDIANLTDAVRVVGLDAIKQYVLSPFLNVFEIFTPADPHMSRTFVALTTHALLVARLARRLAKRDELRNSAFLAGILHDLGQLFLLTRMPASAEAIHCEAAAKDCAVEAIEARRLGVTHAELGAYLLGLWGIPHELADAVARHHDLGPAQPGDDLATTLRLADWLALEYQARTARQVENPEVVVLDVDEALLRSCGLERVLPRLFAMAHEVAAELPDPALLTARASSRRVHIAQVVHIAQEPCHM